MLSCAAHSPLWSFSRTFILLWCSDQLQRGTYSQELSDLYSVHIWCTFFPFLFRKTGWLCTWVTQFSWVRQANKFSFVSNCYIVIIVSFFSTLYNNRTFNVKSKTNDCQPLPYTSGWKFTHLQGPGQYQRLEKGRESSHRIETTKWVVRKRKLVVSSRNYGFLAIWPC